MFSSSLHFDQSTGQQLPANVSQQNFSQSLQSCLPVGATVPLCQSLARCGQDQDFQVELRPGASDVMAGAGGAAGPAPDVRHQPPGDGKEES